jgi:hypothetical protein
MSAFRKRNLRGVNRTEGRPRIRTHSRHLGPDGAGEAGPNLAFCGLDPPLSARIELSFGFRDDLSLFWP